VRRRADVALRHESRGFYRIVDYIAENTNRASNWQGVHVDLKSQNKRAGKMPALRKVLRQEQRLPAFPATFAGFFISVARVWGFAREHEAVA
jgi:hypothetical protein